MSALSWPCGLWVAPESSTSHQDSRSRRKEGTRRGGYQRSGILHIQRLRAARRGPMVGPDRGRRSQLHGASRWTSGILDWCIARPPFVCGTIASHTPTEPADTRATLLRPLTPRRRLHGSPWDLLHGIACHLETQAAHPLDNPEGVAGDPRSPHLRVASAVLYPVSL